MRRLAWMTAAMALIGGWAAAADRAKPSPSLVNWAAYPTHEEFAAAYEKVVKPGTFHRTLIRCGVADDGGLQGCRVVQETPAGSGFGAAILALTPKYRRKPPGSSGLRDVLIEDSWSDFDTPADWLKKPKPEDILAVFPKEAFRKGQSGNALVSCIVTVQGALNDCVVREESPATAGFGSAAITLTTQFLMRPAKLAGRPVPSTVNIPINFITDGPGDTFGSKRVVSATLPWAVAPTFADVAAAYPAKARKDGKGGHVTLSCRMTEEGRLAGCSVATSQPSGYGFEAAAKALATRFSFAIATEADRKAARTLDVHLPITFDPTMLTEATPVTGKPTWVSLPGGQEVAAAFNGVKGPGTARARIDCAVQPGGRLSDCKVLAETPAGMGVGEAALKLAPSFRLTTWTDEGLPVVGGRVGVPIRYEPDQAQKPAS